MQPGLCPLPPQASCTEGARWALRGQQEGTQPAEWREESVLSPLCHPETSHPIYG